MPVPSLSLDLLKNALGYGIFTCFLAFLWAPFLTKLLYSLKITRQREFDATLGFDARKQKAGTPIMGGLLVILTVAFVTILFNWERKFTYVPIGVMLLAALLGGLDDVLNIYGERRRNRDLKHILRLIHVHKNWGSKVWLILTLPWAIFKRTSLWLG